MLKGGELKRKAAAMVKWRHETMISRQSELVAAQATDKASRLVRLFAHLSLSASLR